VRGRDGALGVPHCELERDPAAHLGGSGGAGPGPGGRGSREGRKSSGAIVWESFLSESNEKDQPLQPATPPPPGLWDPQARPAAGGGVHEVSVAPPEDPLDAYPVPGGHGLDPAPSPLGPGWEGEGRGRGSTDRGVRCLHL